MLGVILWSNKDQSRAVIWCEDHNDLAYYEADAADPDSKHFTTGDLVRFDLDCRNDTRLAQDPERVAEDEYPHLASALVEASFGLQRETGSLPSCARPQTHVIPFEPRRPAPRDTPVAEHGGEVLWRVFG